MILPRAGAANWLAFLGVGFGATMVGMGFTQSWQTMAACRFVLGEWIFLIFFAIHPPLNADDLL